MDPERYVYLVKFLAHKLSHRRTMPAHFTKEDLEGAGYIGLMKACKKFDARLNSKFTTYASYTIRGAMLDELRVQKLLPRSGDTLPNVVYVPYEEYMASAIEEKFNVYETKEIREKLLTLIDTLPEKQRCVIVWHFFEDMKMSEIAERLGSHISYVCVLYKKALSRLKPLVHECLN